MSGKPPPILATVPGAIPGGGRPDPPVDLDVAERKAWRAIIASLPDYWVDQAGELVLERLCAQVAVCAELERCDGCGRKRQIIRPCRRSRRSTPSGPRRSAICLPNCGRLPEAACGHERLARSWRRCRRRNLGTRGHGVARRSKRDDRVTAADISAFIERFCITPEGAHVGKTAPIGALAASAARRRLR
jgi:hypothetical protein